MVEGVRQIRNRAWRATLVLDDGEIVVLGEWGLKHDAVVAYNTHVAWLGLDRDLLRVPDEDPQGTLMKRFGIGPVSSPPGRKFARVSG